MEENQHQPCRLRMKSDQNLLKMIKKLCQQTKDQHRLKRCLQIKRQEPKIQLKQVKSNLHNKMDNHNRQMVELSRISLQHNPLKILQSKKLQTILLENKLLVVLKTLNKSQSFQQRAVLRNLLKMIFLLMMVMKNSSMIKQIRNKMVSKKIIKR